MIVNTFPLRSPRIVRHWLSTATTRYFSSKSAILDFPIGSFRCTILTRDALNLLADFRFEGDSLVLDPSPLRSYLQSQINLQSTPMDAARITELLAPFLGAPSKHVTNVDQPGAPLNAEVSPERSGELAQRPSKEETISLSPAQLQHISTYIDILLRWNARINLTAIRDPEEIVTRHFGESLFAARHLFPAAPSVPSVVNAVDSIGDVGFGAGSGRALGAGERAPGGRAALQGRVESEEETRALAPEATRVADIGAGAGFPGIPLKIWAPDIALTLIESNHKKATFLREIARALTLTGVNIQNARAETIAGIEFDVVTLRAVERFEAILPTAGRLVSPGGCMALLISAAQEDQACFTLPDLTWSIPFPIPYSRSRILLIGHKQPESGVERQ
jgi:16S rRNA (guanine527-N7)-methyltransferase